MMLSGNSRVSPSSYLKKSASSNSPGISFKGTTAVTPPSSSAYNSSLLNSSFTNASREELTLYIQELLSKLDEDTLFILKLEQENAELKGKTANQLEIEVKSRIKLEEYTRRIETELEKANSFIQFQHQEFTAKVAELEETRQKLVQMMISNQKSTLKKKDNTNGNYGDNNSPIK